MRKAEITRGTSETEVVIKINLDGTGKTSFATGLPFLEHMLDQIGRHGMIDLDIKANGDLHIDDHHTIEDIGITLGEAFNKAVGDKKGIRRYGHSYVPLDDTGCFIPVYFNAAPNVGADITLQREGNIILSWTSKQSPYLQAVPSSIFV